MKPFLFVLPILLLLTSCTTTRSSRSNEADVQARLETLFTACRERDGATAATAIVYRGDDEARRWNDVTGYEAEDEKRYVDRVCEEIRDLLAGSDAYAWGEYLEEAESEGVWHVQAVIFEKGVQREERYFAFLKIGEVFALGDVD